MPIPLRTTAETASGPFGNAGSSSRSKPCAPPSGAPLATIADRVANRSEVPEARNRKPRSGGRPREADLETSDSTPVAAQWEALRALRDGWLDGEGRAPSPEGLDRLAARFDEYYPDRLPAPRIYPTPAGGAWLEWTLGSVEVNVEVDLVTGAAEWHSVDLASGDDMLDALDLTARRGWELLTDRLERLVESSS